MAWSAADIPDQTGRVAVVTGGNGGLGLETVRELARKGATVVIGARNLDKAAAAEADVRSGTARYIREEGAGARPCRASATGRLCRGGGAPVSQLCR